MIYFFIERFQAYLVPDLEQAFTAEAVGIVTGYIIFLCIVKGNAVALAGSYIPYFTFESGSTAGAGFGFVTRHNNDAKILFTGYTS